MNDKTNTKTKPADDAPLAALAAELDACRKAVDFCFDLALGPDELPEVDLPRPPWNKVGDLRDRFNVMDMAIRLMEASGKLAEAMGKMNGGATRQAITVDRYEHGAPAAAAGQNLSTQKMRQRRDNARAIQLLGEGEGPEK